VDRVRHRYLQDAEASLLDHRGDSGSAKVTDEYVLELLRVVAASPQDYGYPRPTLTQELLVRVLADRTGIIISVSTMCRLLRRLRIRREMPKPTVGCPWLPRACNCRIRLIRRLIETLPEDEVAVYEDEVDLHLNPKIGPGYMLCGQQKTVLTPGKNVKHYLAGAMDAKTAKVTWVEGDRKRSTLFIALLKRLVRVYASCRVIHVILDNYRIHTSQTTQQAVEQFEGRIVLHFLPLYCPDDNKIERNLCAISMRMRPATTQECGPLLPTVHTAFRGLHGPCFYCIRNPPRPHYLLQALLVNL